MSLNCEFSRSYWDQAIIRNKRLYTSLVSYFSDDVVLKIKSITGKHEIAKTNEHVQGLILEDVPFASFPRTIYEIFPRLTHLNINFCGLTSISSRDLKGLEKLIHLSVTHNSLTTLPDNLLENTPNLQVICFNDNRIKYFTSKLLQPVISNDLLEVNFLRNETISACFGIYLTKTPTKFVNRYEAESVQELIEIIDTNCKDPSKLNTPERKYCELLFTEGIEADFVLIAGAKELPVHKTILAMNSSVFRDMFETIFDGNSPNHLVVDGLKTEAVEEFVEYLYNHKPPKPVHALEILTLANRFDVKALKSTCKQIILENLFSPDEIGSRTIDEIQEAFDSEFIYHAIDPEVLKRIINRKIIVKRQRKLKEISK